MNSSSVTIIKTATSICLRAILATAVLVAFARSASAGDFNQSGNLLIADQFNNRVIEISPNGDIVFQFGIGPNDVSAKSILGVNDTQRVGKLTLMAGTGAPAANPPFEPNCANGCADNRVMLVDRKGSIRWQYGKFGVTGPRPDHLTTPVQ